MSVSGGCTWGPGRGRWNAAPLLAIGACLGAATLIRPILYYALPAAALLAFAGAPGGLFFFLDT